MAHGARLVGPEVLCAEAVARRTRAVRGVKGEKPRLDLREGKSVVRTHEFARYDTAPYRSEVLCAEAVARRTRAVRGVKGEKPRLDLREGKSVVRTHEFARYDTAPY